MNEALYNVFGGDRISSRQIDELIGLAKGVAADGVLSQAEIELLQAWLAANANISSMPLINTLYRRIGEILGDGRVDAEESSALLEALKTFSGRSLELGEAMKATTLPLCDPAPDLKFSGRRYCFTGTFSFGQRKECEKAVADRGGAFGSLTMKTDYLVIGVYATDSWKHSSFGNKILKACEWRDRGKAIAIVSEQHWTSFLTRAAVV